MRPSLPGIRVVTVPSPFGSTIAGPASGVDSDLPVRSFVTVCVNAARWMTVRVTLPLESKYVVVRRTPLLWIVTGNEQRPPAGKWNVLSTFTSIDARSSCAGGRGRGYRDQHDDDEAKSLRFHASLLRIRCRTLRRAEGRGGGRKADSRDAIF